MSRRGLSLIEVVFTMVLVGGLLALLAYLLRFGFISHNKGELSRKAQATCRTLVEQISAELRTAQVIPSLQQPAGIVPKSAVLWPGPYDDVNVDWGDNWWSRRQEANVPPSNLNYSVTPNRLIFTKPTSSFDSATIDLANQFVYVEYVVPAPPLNKVLLRRIYRLSSGPGAPPSGQVFQGVGQLNGERWVPVPGYFFPNGGSLLPITGTTEKQSVVQLTGETDELSFEVWQAAHRDYRGVDTGFYEPNLFLIKGSVTLRYQDQVGRAEFSTQANLQARE